MSYGMSLLIIAAGLVYIGLMVVALVTTRGDASLRNLSRAVRIYGWAITAETLLLAARLVQHRSIFWIALAVATLGMAVYCQYAARQRRNLKADRVQLDAERTVRDWRGGLW